MQYKLNNKLNVDHFEQTVDDLYAKINNGDSITNI
jgi:hypothetical protein